MGLRIIEGHEAGTDDECAVLFDSVTGIVFGRRMGSHNEVEAFIRWAREVRDVLDLRRLPNHETVKLQDDWYAGNRPGYDAGTDEMIVYRR